MKKRYVSGKQPSLLFYAAVFFLCLLLALLLFSDGKDNAGKNQPLKLDIRLSSDGHEIPSNTIRFYNPETKKIEQLQTEEYIVGVVAAEMPASFQPEALKAQAVAARTLAVYKSKKGGCSYGGDLCGYSNHCQAWVSVEGMHKKWGDNFDTNYAKIKKAAESTAGKIIVYEDEPIQVLYHSSSGGVTEDVENVFANTLPYLRSVQSSGEENASHFENRVSMSEKDFYSVLRAHYKGVDEQQGIRIVSTYPSGRVNEISAGGVTLTGKRMRSLFGLDSTLFSVSCSGDSVTITTRGFGHGVGMSQAGANAMAQNGSDYEDILKHYYTDVEIKANYGTSRS